MFHPNCTRTISITSGKGGVGKSTLVANLAILLADRGHKVLVLDGDLGMANIDVMMGVRTIASVADLLNEDADIEDVVMQVGANLFLLPGGSGIYGLQNLSTSDRHKLLMKINSMDLDFDFMLVDTASGIDDNVLYLNAAAQQTLVVLNPDPSSLTDAYALIKVMNKTYSENKFAVVCNMVADEREALQMFKRLSDVTGKFLNVHLSYWGHVPLDPELRRCTKTQQLIVRDQLGAPSAKALVSLSRKIEGVKQLDGQKGGLQFFWQKVAGLAS